MTTQYRPPSIPTVVIGRLGMGNERTYLVSLIKICLFGYQLLDLVQISIFGRLDKSSSFGRPIDQLDHLPHHNRERGLHLQSVDGPTIKQGGEGWQHTHRCTLYALLKGLDILD